MHSRNETIKVQDRRTHSNDYARLQAIQLAVIGCIHLIDPLYRSRQITDSHIINVEQAAERNLQPHLLNCSCCSRATSSSV